MLSTKSSLRWRIILVLTFSLVLSVCVAAITSVFAHRNAPAGSERVRSSSASIAQQQNAHQSNSVTSQAAPEVNGKIAFTSERDGNSEIYLMNADGTDQINLTNDPGPDVTPAWSFNGKRIAFASTRDSGSSHVPRDIYIMDAAGHHIENLTNNTSIFDVRLYDPYWCPAGNKIVFISNFLRDSSNLVISNLDGSGVRGFDSNSEVIAPAWSPDGTRLAFIARNGGQIQDSPRFYLYVINADGSGKTRVTLDRPASFFKFADLGGPAWSPDGTKLAFANSRDGNAEIYVIDAGGGNPQRLTTNSSQDVFPSWSPDGTMIAFASNREGNFEIYVMNADGSNQKQITDNNADNYDPVWQPLLSTVLAPVPPTIQFGSPAYRVSEPQDAISPGDPLTVTRLGDLSGAQAVDYVTADGNARSGFNYLATTGSLHFAPGEGTKIIASPVLHNGVIEGDLQFHIILLNPAGAGLGGTTTAAVTITDIDIPVPGRNQLDNPQFFVHQQYHDFLNREPDAAGFAYWTSQITQCNGDPVCEHNRRIDVAAAFFISQEFQQSGFFIQGFYRASLGRRPAFSEFNTDHNEVVGGSDLESSKVSFANAFVQRAEFLSRYPASLDGPGFINALAATVQQNSGVDLSGQRAALTADFIDCVSNGAAPPATCRARSIREIVELPVFAQAEYNRAFVLAEYFGFLHREPDAGGYEFWLNVLDNRQPGNYRGMVCSFITSIEYQMHFGASPTRSNSNCVF